MTRSRVMHATASDAFDHMMSGWLESDTPECIARLREDFGMEHWEARVRGLEGKPGCGWQVFFSESEEDSFHQLGWRIGELIQDAALTIAEHNWVVLYEGGSNTRVRVGITQASGLLIVEFADDLCQEGGTLWTYIVGEVTDDCRRGLGILWPHERVESASVPQDNKSDVLPEFEEFDYEHHEKIREEKVVLKIIMFYGPDRIQMDEEFSHVTFHDGTMWTRWSSVAHCSEPTSSPMYTSGHVTVPVIMQLLMQNDWSGMN